MLIKITKSIQYLLSYTTIITVLIQKTYLILRGHNKIFIMCNCVESLKDLNYNTLMTEINIKHIEKCNLKKTT